MRLAIDRSDLASLPRALAHSITRQVGNWKYHTADISNEVTRAVDEYAGGERSRLHIAELLHKYAPHPNAQTAVVMIWGGARGDNLKKALTSPPRINPATVPRWAREADGKLAAAHQVLWNPCADIQGDDQGEFVAPETAFEKIWRFDDYREGLLHGVGTAFGTKILYWAARSALRGQAPERAIPLIYDLRVYQCLKSLGFEGSVAPTATMPFNFYAAYCDAAFAWAERLNALQPDGPPFQPDDIEYWLFTLGDGARATATESGRRVSAGGGPEDEGLDPSSSRDEETVTERDLIARIVRELAAQPENLAPYLQTP